MHLWTALKSMAYALLSQLAAARATRPTASTIAHTFKKLLCLLYHCTNGLRRIALCCLECFIVFQYNLMLATSVQCFPALVSLVSCHLPARLPHRSTRLSLRHRRATSCLARRLLLVLRLVVLWSCYFLFHKLIIASAFSGENSANYSIQRRI